MVAFRLVTGHMIWRARGTSKKNPQMAKIMFNFQHKKGILIFLGMNLLSTFCTLWNVLLLGMNSYMFCLNHVYNAAWWGFTWKSAFKSLKKCSRVRGYNYTNPAAILYTSVLLKLWSKAFTICWVYALVKLPFLKQILNCQRKKYGISS